MIVSSSVRGINLRKWRLAMTLTCAMAWTTPTWSIYLPGAPTNSIDGSLARQFAASAMSAGCVILRLHWAMRCAVCCLPPCAMSRPPRCGGDIWNAYELSWLNERGKPHIAIATFCVPANSPNIAESKSFKLYLGSFSSIQDASVDALCDTLKRDVSACAGATVSVQLTPPVGFGQLMLGELGGVSLDRLDLDIEIDEPDASLLSADAKQAPIDETVVSNLLKSNCP